VLVKRGDWIISPIVLAVLPLLIDGEVQELENLTDDRCWVSVEVFAFENQELFSRKVLHPVAQLLDVNTSGEVTVMAVVEAVIVGIGDDFGCFSFQSGGL